MKVLQTQALSKIYGAGDTEVRALATKPHRNITRLYDAHDA